MLPSGKTSLNFKKLFNVKLQNLKSNIIKIFFRSIQIMLKYFDGVDIKTIKTVKLWILVFRLFLSLTKLLGAKASTNSLMLHVHLITIKTSVSKTFSIFFNISALTLSPAFLNQTFQSDKFFFS